ncbi:hypothetical protein [Thalassoporum mexicanum]|uniref:hypothetical protein n=1 Tax=Thalassoporum mexicanum TaxID=3457544 RepID=UPI0012E9A029|nr:hypothetical protein [Pseudanabaena sp. PCC 7367]
MAITQKIQSSSGALFMTLLFLVPVFASLWFQMQQMPVALYLVVDQSDSMKATGELDHRIDKICTSIEEQTDIGDTFSTLYFAASTEVSHEVKTGNRFDAIRLCDNLPLDQGNVGRAGGVWPTTNWINQSRLTIDNQHQIANAKVMANSGGSCAFPSQKPDLSDTLTNREQLIRQVWRCQLYWTNRIEAPETLTTEQLEQLLQDCKNARSGGVAPPQKVDS